MDLVLHGMSVVLVDVCRRPARNPPWLKDAVEVIRRAETPQETLDYEYP